MPVHNKSVSGWTINIIFFSCIQIYAEIGHDFGEYWNKKRSHDDIFSFTECLRSKMKTNVKLSWLLTYYTNN